MNFKWVIKSNKDISDQIIVILLILSINKFILIQVQQNAAHLCSLPKKLKENYVLQNTAI